MSNVESALIELIENTTRDIVQDEMSSIDWSDVCSEAMGIDPVSVEQAIELVEQHEDTLSDLQEIISNLNDASELQEQINNLDSKVQILLNFSFQKSNKHKLFGRSALDNLAQEVATHGRILESLLEKPARFPRLRRLLSRLVFWK